MTTLLVSLAVMAALTGCGTSGSDRDETDTGAGGKLNPPGWLVGKWQPETAIAGQDIEVTAHNVILSSGNLDYSAQIEKGYLSDFKENLNGNVYTLSYKMVNQGGATGSCSFEPDGDGKMKLSMGIAVVPVIYIKKR